MAAVMKDTVREPTTEPIQMESRARRRAVTLTAIKTVHTLTWFSIESCMMYLLYSGFRRKSDRRAAIAAAVVGGESLVFAANGFHCPLTKVAESLGAERGGVTDIFLPRWFAHYLPVIHAPLLALVVWLHGRNLRSRGIRTTLENEVTIEGLRRAALYIAWPFTSYLRLAVTRDRRGRKTFREARPGRKSR